MALVLLVAAGCQVNPETGRNQWIVLPEDREISIGLQAAPKFLKDYGGPLPSDGINSYVRQIGEELASKSSRPDLPWEFHVVDSKIINAFALPGGKVFMSRGLLEHMDNEAQLAGVLGHEVGHVTALHINDQMGRSIALGAVVAGLGIAGAASDDDMLRALGVGAAAGGSVVLLKFNRDQEHEADKLGVKYMTKCNYNPMGQVQVMEILADQASDTGAPLEFLSTHPLPENRVKRLNKHIAKKYSDHETDEGLGFYEQRFKEMVLTNLSELPPAKHPSEKAESESES